MDPLVLRGVPGSRGLAAGNARTLSRFPLPQADADVDMDPAGRVDEALDAAARELDELADRLRAEGHHDEAEIIAIGSLIAHDPVLRSQARTEAKRTGSAARALETVSEEHAGTIERLGDATLSERAADVRQVGRRAAALAAPLASTASNGHGGGPAILVAEELGPADILGLQSGSIAAGVSVKGGPNSHAAIVARSLGIPLVLGVSSEILEVEDGTPLIVDGQRAEVTVRPGAAEMKSAEDAMRTAAELRDTLAAERTLPAKTIDGTDVGLLCNVATLEEVAAGLTANAEGIGLLRTELPFLESERWPDEAAHTKVLEPIFEALVGKLVTVRVLDFGGDKVPPFLAGLGA
ncbi:MAG: multiphosphoryl transfer protein, partial [Actinomycetota bacterium]|nr:multiphosphoryl transfer protein [Actinomycetota bacterium]